MLNNRTQSHPIFYRRIAITFSVVFLLCVLLASRADNSIVLKMVELTTHLVGLYCCWKLMFETSSNEVRMFLRYLCIVLIISLVVDLFPLVFAQKMSPIWQSYISLFTFVFLFIVIEATLHSRDRQVNYRIIHYLPSLTSIVLLFSYLVIVPTMSVAIDQVENYIAYFQVAATLLLCLRVLLLALSTFETHWKKLYLVSFLAFLGLMAEGIFNLLIHIGDTNILQNMVYLCAIFSIVVLLWACVEIKQLPNDDSVEFVLMHEQAYVTICTLFFVCIHLAISEIELIVFDFSISHHMIVTVWVSLATCYLLYMQQRQNSTWRQQKLSIERLKHSYKRQQYELQDLSEQFINSEEKAIVRASNNAILTCSVAGDILSANPAAIQMFQSLEQELLNTKVSQLFPSADELHFFFNYKSNLNKLEREDLGITRESIALRSDGSQFPAQVELQWAQRQLAPVIVITIINLTDRKRAEKKALDQKDQFLANISHEFRTPLTIINGLLDQYLLKTSSESEIQDLTTAKKNGLRLVRMVEQLLELSKISDNPTLHKGKFKLSTLLKLPIDSFNKLAVQNGQQFHHEISEDIWIKCDAQAFEKIIFNLLSNAFKYTPKDGEISLYATCSNDSVLLEVIDNGIGISEQAQDTIFERFQRGEANKEIAAFGVGIGLSLVSELVKAHHWDIALSSTGGVGSKFTLIIPNETPSEKEDVAPESILLQDVSNLLQIQDNSEFESRKGSNLVALIIEDNKDMQLHIKQVLDQSYHCILADDGESGIDLAINYIPDIIICDLMLTGIDGFEVLQYIKQHEMTSHVPIIMLTARSDLDTRLKGLSLHADDYMSKPFNYKELLSRMDNLLSGRESLKQTYLAEFKNNIKVNRKVESQSNMNQLAQSPVILKTPDEKFLEKLEIIIAQHYVDPSLDISSLSSLIAMSERQLQRKIKMLLGVSPSIYIKEFRLMKAKELLLSGNQVGRIALDVGFSSQTYFGRCFKDVFNCTPKQFQQNHTKSGKPITF